MINENTLDILQNIAFGADIDSLESYIADFKFADRLTNMSKYRHNYNKMLELLKEIKPDSSVIAESNINDIPLDKFDKYFEQYGNIRKPLMYNVLDNIASSDVRDKINKSSDSMSDILALVNVQGLDIMCTYKDGYLCKVYLIGESKKIVDITYYLSDKLPSRIKTFSSHELVELRGKLTILKENIETSQRLEATIAHKIRCRVNTDILDIVFNDIISDNLVFSNQWDKMEFLQSIEDINIANYVLIRSIDCDILHQALIDIDKAFADIQSDIDWYTYGFEVRLNNYLDNNTGFICILDDADYRKEFSAIVKSIYTDKSTNKQILKIVNTECNKRFNVDYIEIQDLYDIEKHNIRIGDKIQFKIIEKQPIIVKA